MNMKFLVCSDIHGSETACKKIVYKFFEEKCDKIILLGDILYHGPRNPLPEGHNPKGVIALLNPLAEKIICCRGNCDAEVDQMVLNFPCLADYTLTYDGNIEIFASHGHVYSPLNEEGSAAAVSGSKLPPVFKTNENFLENEKKAGAAETDYKKIVLFGHTHIQKSYTINGIKVCNPGSPSLPKESSPKGYAIIDNGEITLKSL